MRLPKYRINLTEHEQTELERLVRKHSTAHSIVKRARIILLANGGTLTYQAIADQVGMYKCDVTRWTKRWTEQQSEPVDCRLRDAPRSGAPSRITAEQWCQIMALACESPSDHGFPITHWTHRELAVAVVDQGIVDSISPRHIGTFLKKRFATASKPLLAECQSR